MSHPSLGRSKAEARPNYAFGDFELSPRPLSLSCRDAAVPLQPQPARLLAILVDRAGRVVTREEIRDEMWPDGEFLDHEQAINFAVRKIRLALDDDARSPRYVETVPRLGYRFVATVERRETPPPQRPEVSDRSPRRPTLSLQARMAGAVAALALVVLLLAPIGDGHEALPSQQRITPPPDALLDDLYLQGRFLVEQENPDDIRLGIAKLRRVVAEHPDLAEAHFALAAGFYRQAAGGHHFSTFMPEVEEKLRHALDADPNLADAHWLLGEVLFVYHRRWAEAEAEVRRSIALGDQESSEALRRLAMIRAAKGHTAEAVEIVRRAVALDPAVQLHHSDLVLCLMFDRRFDEALEASRTHLEVAPLDQKNLFLDATLRYHLGDREGSLVSFTKLFTSWGDPPVASTDEAFERLFAIGETRRREGRRAHLPLALLHALVGNTEASLDFLVEACDHDPHWELPTVGVDPRFDRVRELPGFAELADCFPPIDRDAAP